jgi:uncharacterized membrane protein YqaE (UPF0057 family)
MVLKRLTITLINILFPPLAILLLCGPEIDFIINCLLFLAAVIPSHVHAFYISCTYFNRKRKVRKGVYPGKWRWGIYSERVQRGGASNTEIARLKREMAEGEEVHVHCYDEERSGGRREGKTRTNGYDSEVQQVPSRTRTTNRRYEPDRQQAPSRSRTRSSG